MLALRTILIQHPQIWLHETMPLFKRRHRKEYREAVRLIRDGRPDRAVPLLRALLQREPDSVDTLVALAVALLESSPAPSMANPSTQEALALLDSAASLAPDDPTPLFNKGVCYRKMGRLEDALDTFSAVLGIDRRNALATLHMAEICYELGRWEEAVEYARVALIRDPGFEEALHWVPDAMRRAGMLSAESGSVDSESNDEGAEQ